MAIEVSHCGSGCTLGDVISEFAIFALGLTIAGLTLGAEYNGNRRGARSGGIEVLRGPAVFSSPA